MTRRDGLNARQQRFVTAMITSRTVEEAARATGVTERTGFRYLAKSIVREALSDALADALGTVTRQAVSAMTDALHTLETIHKDMAAPTSSRVSAAKAILESGVKMNEMFDLVSRIEDLEEKVKERTR